MTIINKPLAELREYENNPRHNESAVDYVANSIQEFGFRVPIIVDTRGVIVAGHTRYKAAMSLGYTVVPCIVADDLTDEQITAFRLADNKTAELAGWDFAVLDTELAEIVGLEEEYNIDDLFIDDNKQAAAKAPHRVRCPHCGSVVES